MVYRLKDIPSVSSPVIRPRFSFGEQSKSNSKPSFKFESKPHFSMGSDNIVDLNDKTTKYLLACGLCALVALAYIYKYKPECCMKVDDNGIKSEDFALPKVAIIGVGLPVIVGLLLVQLHEKMNE